MDAKCHSAKQCPFWTGSVLNKIYAPGHISDLNRLLLIDTDLLKAVVDLPHVLPYKGDDDEF